MPLPAPQLDDRTFQDILDEARRLIPQILPGVDRPQPLRPGDHPPGAVRLDDRPAPLPPQPRPGAQLRQVPRPDRPAPPPGPRGDGGHRLPPHRPAGAGCSHPRRDGSGDGAHGDAGGGGLRHRPRPGDPQAPPAAHPGRTGRNALQRLPAGPGRPATGPGRLQRRPPGGRRPAAGVRPGPQRPYPGHHPGLPHRGHRGRPQRPAPGLGGLGRPGGALGGGAPGTGRHRGT